MNPIKKARTEAKYSQQELADLLSTTVQNIRLYEAGQKTPSQEVLNFFGLSEEDINIWKMKERELIHQFLGGENNFILQHRSDEFIGNLLFFKSQILRMPKVKTFDDLIKTYFTSKSFCSKLLLINHSSLDRHVNGLPLPMKEALMGMGLSGIIKVWEGDIYGQY